MNTEDLKEAHNEALQPKTIEELAEAIDLSQPAQKIADDNDKKTLLFVLNKNGVNADTLNMSPSKFLKMNKLQLVNALKDFKNPKQKTEKKSEEKKEAAIENPLDMFYQFGEIIKQARETGDYKPLDGAVLGIFAQSVGGTIDQDTIERNEKPIIYSIIGLSAVYGVSRLIGFENIGNKLASLKDKFFGVKKDD